MNHPFILRSRTSSRWLVEFSFSSEWEILRPHPKFLRAPPHAKFMSIKSLSLDFLEHFALIFSIRAHSHPLFSLVSLVTQPLPFVMRNKYSMDLIHFPFTLSPHNRTSKTLYNFFYLICLISVQGSFWRLIPKLGEGDNYS